MKSVVTLLTEFLTIYTVIIGLYFGPQGQKMADANAACYTGAQQGTVVEGDGDRSMSRWGPLWSMACIHPTV